MTVLDHSRGTVAVQGLGFVGAAMAVAVAQALDPDGRPRFDVIGVDLDNEVGRGRVEALQAGRFPFATTDTLLTAALARAAGRNLEASFDPTVYARAGVIVVDVPLDIDWRATEPELQLDGFEAAIRTIGRHVEPGALVLVETTVPPGTTARVVVPALGDELRRRGLPADSVLVAHSYERVMPGPDYLASIVHYWRVYAGHTPAATDAAEAFLSAVVDAETFPLTRLSSTTASETAKVLENTFRATTIALMDEWARFAEATGVDLFEVVDAVRRRPTHANTRTPGFGVGGYCLTKDPLFAKLAARELFGQPMPFPLSTAAVRINDHTPIGVVDRLRDLLGGSLRGRRILLAGVSYRADIGDTRYSPSETFARAVLADGAHLEAHDPLVDFWPELERSLPSTLPSPAGFDAVVFAVAHPDYRALPIGSWLDGARPLLLDGFDVLSEAQHREAAELGCPVATVGRGHRPHPATTAPGTEPS